MNSLFKKFTGISPSGYQYKDKKSTHPFWEEEGGSDVSSYNDLTDLPKIGGIEVRGNKSLASYHLYSRDEVDGKLDAKQNVLTPGSNITITEDGVISAQTGGSGGTTDYEDLTNKPQINGVTLVGNKTSGDLNMYTKTEVNNLIAQSGGAMSQVVTKVDPDMRDPAIEDKIAYLTSNSGVLNIRLTTPIPAVLRKYGYDVILTGYVQGTTSANIINLAGVTSKGYSCMLSLRLSSVSNFKNSELTILSDDGTTVADNSYKINTMNLVATPTADNPNVVKAQTGSINISDSALNINDKDFVTLKLKTTYGSVSYDFRVSGIYTNSAGATFTHTNVGVFTFVGYLYRISAGEYRLQYCILKTTANTGDITFTLGLQDTDPVVIDTLDYNDLTNKPSIGGVTLSGEKSAADLGLQTKMHNRRTFASGSASVTYTGTYTDFFSIGGDLTSEDVYATINGTATVTLNNGTVLTDVPCGYVGGSSYKLALDLPTPVTTYPNTVGSNGAYLKVEGRFTNPVIEGRNTIYDVTISRVILYIYDDELTSSPVSAVTFNSASPKPVYWFRDKPLGEVRIAQAKYPRDTDFFNDTDQVFAIGGNTKEIITNVSATASGHHVTNIGCMNPVVEFANPDVHKDIIIMGIRFGIDSDTDCYKLIIDYNNTTNAAITASIKYAFEYQYYTQDKQSTTWI